MKYIDCLGKDSKMRKVLQTIPAESLQKTRQKSDLREYLVSSIISQQLSVKVADVIKRRFLALYPGEFPTNKQILSSTTEALRGIGLSNQKLAYIKNIARHFEDHKLDDHDWDQMEDEEIIRFLTEIKGVGQWTAEMVLMFGLGRPDVFSAGDYGIQQAMKKLYKIDLEGKALRERMHKISEKWKPFRSIACLYLWAWKDNP